MTKVEFSWDDVFARRRKIAKLIQKRLQLSFFLSVEESFGALPLTSQSLADKPMNQVPFFVIAQRMISCADHHHIIDHAWWLLSDDSEHEPWGFVTEPYIEPEEAARVALILSNQYCDWGITVDVLGQSLSAWYPNSTVPIVTTSSSGYLYDFLRLGVGAALTEMES